MEDFILTELIRIRRQKVESRKYGREKNVTIIVMLKLRVYIAEFFSKQIQKACRISSESYLQWSLLNFEGKL